MLASNVSFALRRQLLQRRFHQQQSQPKAPPLPSPPFLLLLLGCLRTPSKAALTPSVPLTLQLFTASVGSFRMTMQIYSGLLPRIPAARSARPCLRRRRSEDVAFVPAPPASSPSSSVESVSLRIRREAFILSLDFPAEGNAGFLAVANAPKKRPRIRRSHSSTLDASDTIATAN